MTNLKNSLVQMDYILKIYKNQIKGD